jgi:hypothetical protein
MILFVSSHDQLLVVVKNNEVCIPHLGTEECKLYPVPKAEDFTPHMLVEENFQILFLNERKVEDTYTETFEGSLFMSFPALMNTAIKKEDRPYIQAANAYLRLIEEQQADAYTQEFEEKNWI